MAKSIFDKLITNVSEDIKALPIGSVQLAGAMVAANPHIPCELANWIMQELSKRVDMREVSPVVEAAMRISIFAESFDEDHGFREVQSQYALIKVLRKEHELHIALTFFEKLCSWFENALTHSYQPGKEVRALMYKLGLKN